MTLGNDGVNASTSSFRDIVGHTWYAAQWKQPKIDFHIPKDFWENGQGKVVINYESFYDHLAAFESAARQQGWTSYLNGMFGYGYGVQDIWLLNSTYKMNEDTKVGDYTVTIEDKKIEWYDSIKLPVGNQLGQHMRNFFASFEWWKLVPCFDDPELKYIGIYSGYYSAATIGNETYVAYFYNKTTATGNLCGLEPGKTYTAKWYNPRSGEYMGIGDDIVGTSEKSYWKIPDKPDDNDWVVYMTLNK